MIIDGNYDRGLVRLLAVFAISAVTVALLGGISYVLRRVWMTTGRPPANRRQTELSFHTVAQTAPAILWTAGADGSVHFLSHQLYDYSGVPQGEGVDWDWKQALHPDDVGACMERWEHSIRPGDA